MNIFVAKLSFDTDSEGLREAFEAYGEVSSAKVITDFNTGKSKGYGFVEMVNDDEARQAIQDLDNTELDGHTIVVKEARPKEEMNRGGGGGGFKKPFGGGNRNFGGGGGGGDRFNRDRNRTWDRDRGY